MAALTSLALAAGIGSMAYGAYNSYAGSQTAKSGYQQAQQGAYIQAQAAAQQSQIYKEQAASSVNYASQDRNINVQAAQNSAQAALTSRGINQGIINNELNIQDQQRKAMELDARRSSLEILRNQQRARAMALATGVSQGGSGYVAGSSVRGGAYGQISGQSGVNLMGVQQNLQIGEDIFSANSNINQGKIAANDLEYQYALQQAQTQTDKANLAYGYAQINAGYQSRLADTQTLMSQGQGQVSAGQGYAQMGNTQMQLGSSFMNAGQSIFSAGLNIDKLLGGSTANNTYGSLLGTTGITGGQMANLFTFRNYL